MPFTPMSHSSGRSGYISGNAGHKAPRRAIMPAVTATSPADRAGTRTISDVLGGFRAERSAFDIRRPQRAELPLLLVRARPLRPRPSSRVRDLRMDHVG